MYGLFAGIYYYSGKILGYQINELTGHIHFWIFTIAINVVFFPMHSLGYSGMPRRIPDYPDGYLKLSEIMTFGSILTLISVIYFFHILINSLTKVVYSNTRFH